ncbi:MAG: VOC family protein [Solirubrobacterales bacterium]
MFQDNRAFGSFSVDDPQKARRFYGETLGMKISEAGMGAFQVQTGNGAAVFVYPKPNHEPASFTVFNIAVDDVEQAVDDLTAQGVTFERYDGDIKTDEKGISSGPGPKIAWFKDPAGNILSVLNMHS